MAMKRNAKPDAPALVRCAIYLRVSVSDADSDNDPESQSDDTPEPFTSIDAQRDTNKGHIARIPGGVFAGEYCDDGRSGKNLDRKDLLRLMDDIVAGKIDCVIVYKYDRLSRSIRDFIGMMGFFEQHGVSFVSVSQAFDTTNAVGRLTLHMLASFAEFEREINVERTKDKIASSRKQGLWTGGMAPYGYDLIAKQLKVNPVESPIVRQAFALCLETRSARAVAEALNEAKAPLKVRRFRNRDHSAPCWTKTMVLLMLRNPIYIGVIDHKGKHHKGKHEAIVDRDTFDRVQALIDGNMVDHSAHKRDPSYVLRGVLTCGCVASDGTRCDHALTPASTRKRGRTYRYYRCVGRDKRGPDSCPSSQIAADALETLIADHIRTIAASGDVARKLRAAVDAIVNEHGASLREQTATLPDRIVSLSAHSADLMRLLDGADERGREALEPTIKDTNTKLANARTESETVTRKLALLDQLKSETEWIVEELAGFSVWEALKADSQNRLLRALIRTIRIDTTSITIAFAPEASVLWGRALSGTAKDAPITPDEQIDSNPVAVVESFTLHHARTGKAGAVELRVAPPGPKRQPAAIAVVLATAHAIEHAIQTQRLADRSTIARQFRLSPGRMTQILDLALLAPDLQETLLHLEALDGAQPMNEFALRNVTRFRAWDDQRRVWAERIEPMLVRARAV